MRLHHLPCQSGHLSEMSLKRTFDMSLIEQEANVMTL